VEAREMQNRLIAWLGVLIFGMTVTALAHHSAIAEYDLEKPVKVTGTVTRVEWSNPHIWCYVDVKNPDGTVTNWGFSGGAPGRVRFLHDLVNFFIFLIYLSHCKGTCQIRDIAIIGRAPIDHK